MTTTGQSLLDQAQAQISGLNTAMATSLASLTDVAMGSSLTWFDPTALAPITLNAPTTVSLQSLGTVPSLDTIATISTMPSLAPVALKSAPDFNYTPVGFEAIQSAVIDIISSGGANVSATIQDAIFNQGIERDIQTQNDALDLAGARTGAKGFRYPNSMTKAQQNEIINTYAYRKADQSREITRTMGDLVQKNLQMAVAAGTSINDALASIAMKTYEVLLDGQRLVLDQFKTESSVAISNFEAQVKLLLSAFDAEKLVYDSGVKGALAKLEADKVVQELAVQYQSQLVKKYEVEGNINAEFGKAEITQAMETNKLRLEAIEALAKTYIGIADAIRVQGVSIVTQKT